MAPDHMKWHAKDPDGRVTREEAERVVKQYLCDKKINFHVKIDYIFKMLVNMGLIFRLEDGTYMFPSHLPLKKLSEVWKKKAEKQVYVGRRHLCSSPTSIFSPSTFTLFQCQVSVKFDINSHLWRDGMIVARAGKCFVQCLTVMVDPLRAVDFVARGGKGSESECLSLLDDVMTEWTEMVAKHSPGTEYKMEFLSRKHLTKHKYQPASYSKEAVEKAKSEGPSAFVTYDYKHAETLSDLLVFTPEEQFPATKPTIVRAVLTHGCSQWYELGLELGFAHAEVIEYTQNIAEGAGKLLALLERKANELSPESLKDLILNACKRIPTPICGIVEDEFDRIVGSESKA